VAETGAMTRIAGTNGTLGQPSIDGSLAHATSPTPDAGTAVGGSGERSRGCGGPDRPAPLGAIRNGHHAADASVFLREIKVWEGEHSNMYVDTRGYVTTGIGHLLKTPGDATKLPWVHSGTGRAATTAEVKVAFARIAQTGADFKRDHPNVNGMTPKEYAKISDLVLPEGLSTKLATDRLNGEFLKGLRKMFPAFDSYPMPAQRALVDMAYNLGVGKLHDRFPKLLGACRETPPNFAAAAVESHRSSCREDRNDATRTLFEQAARLTASVQQFPREMRL
jgi:GH24 family phage-related lysozyme (muramidase)